MMCAKLGTDTGQYSSNKKSEVIDLINATTALTSKIRAIGQIYKNRNDRPPVVQHTSSRSLGLELSGPRVMMHF
jgi:hypothetical protein